MKLGRLNVIGVAPSVIATPNGVRGKQSNTMFLTKAELDCFVTSFLAMTGSDAE